MMNEPIKSQSKQNLKAIQQINQDLNTLRTALNFPTLFISEYFSNLKNYIDIQCEIFLFQRTDTAGEEYQEAIRYRSTLIQEIDKFESQCLENLQKNKFDTNIDPTDEYLSLLSDSDIYDLLYEQFLRLQKEIFLNRTFIFLSKDNGSKSDYELLSCFDLKEIKSFGICIVVEDEFIGERGFCNQYLTVLKFIFLFC